MIFFRFIIFIIFFFNYIYADKGDFEKVTLQLQWKHQFQFAGYYMAKEKGYYKEEGLKVEIKEFRHGISPVDVVVSNKATYGTGRSPLIIDKSNGKPIKMISAIFQSSPLVLLALPKSGITNIKDLKNKTIMYTPDESTMASINAMLFSHGISIEDMNPISHTFNIDDLIDGNTDLTTAYISAQPYKLRKLGIEPIIFDPKDYGFDFYNDILFTSTNEADKYPNRVNRFKQASIKGWEYAFDNIEETVDIILKKYNTQNKTKDELIYEANKLKEFAFYKTDKLGKIEKDKIEKIYNIYKVMGLIKNKINLDELIFNDKKNELNLTYHEQKYIKKNKIIRMCNNQKVEPLEFAYNGDQNDMRGMSIDVLKLIEKQLDIKFINVPTKNWKESQQFLKEKKCDILPAAIKNIKRSKYANFTEAYINLPLAIFSHKDKGYVPSLDALLEENMARREGSGMINVLRKRYPKLNIIQTKTSEETYMKIRDKEADFTLDMVPIAAHVMSKYNIKDIHIAGYTDIVYELRIAVRDDDLLLLNILNKSLHTISKNEHNEIYKKWVNNIIKEKVQDYTLLWQILALFVIIAMAILYKQALLKKTNKDLEEKVAEKTKDLQALNNNLEIIIKEEIEKNQKKEAVIHQQAKLASMGEMIGNIAHQWRQPLSVISTASSGMQVQKEYGMLTDEIFTEFCDAINKNAQYLSKTIDDFRDYIKGDTKIVKYNLIDTINSFVHIVNSSLKSYSINIVLDTEKNRELDGFPNQLNQSLVNIFNNAKDALIQNNEESNRYIFITQKVIDDKIQIILKDNAGGIDENIMDKIFEPYFTTKHQAQGTGLGLHMTYDLIVNSMGGTIEVENIEFEHNGTIQKGAQFIIKLPIKDEDV